MIDGIEWNVITGAEHQFHRGGEGYGEERHGFF
jgi:hypothetical protein